MTQGGGETLLLLSTRAPKINTKWKFHVVALNPHLLFMKCWTVLPLQDSKNCLTEAIWERNISIWLLTAHTVAHDSAINGQMLKCLGSRVLNHVQWFFGTNWKKHQQQLWKPHQQKKTRNYLIVSKCRNTTVMSASHQRLRLNLKNNKDLVDYNVKLVKKKKNTNVLFICL